MLVSFPDLFWCLVVSLEEKVSVLEDENLIMRQKSLSASPKSNRPGFAKAVPEVCHGIHASTSLF